MDGTSNKINKLVAVSSWSEMIMGPCAGYRKVAHCPSKITLHSFLFCFVTDTRLSWSEFYWIICSSVALSGGGQSMLSCN